MKKIIKSWDSENFNLVADNYFQIISPFEGEDLLLRNGKKIIKYFLRNGMLYSQQIFQEVPTSPDTIFCL